MIFRYWSKRFKNRIRARMSSRKPLGINTQVPEIFVDDGSSHQTSSPLVPKILVDDGETPPTFSTSSATTREISFTPIRQVPPPLDLSGESSNFNEPITTFGSSSAAQFGNSDPFATGSPYSTEESPSILRQRPGKGINSDLSPSGSPTGDSPNMSPSVSPVASPRLGPLGGGLARTRSGNDSASRSRQGSEVMSQNVLEVLQSSEWGDQIRSYIESRSGNNSPTNQGGPRSPR